MLRQVDHEKADIVPERFETDLGIAVDIDLPDFQVATEGFQHAEVLRDEVASERVEDRVDPFAIGDLHDPVSKLEGP